MQLLDFPREVLNGVLRECYPADLGKLSQCCKLLNDYISTDYLLHKQIYLSNFDRSSRIAENSGIHWQRSLRRYIKLLKLLETEQVDIKRTNFQFIGNAICDFLKDGCSDYGESRNIEYLSERCNQSSLDALLCQSTLFARVRGETRLRSKDTNAQLSAKLHCLYGVPITSSHANCSLSDCVYTYPYAISKVYDLRNYTTKTLWGPFLDDSSQRVDWEMVESIMIVLGKNLSSKDCAAVSQGFWSKPFLGATENSYISEELPRLLNTMRRTPIPNWPTPPDGFVDPYGINGTWIRVVCFLDYRDFFDYNFAHRNPPGEPLVPYDTEEAIRLIVMSLRAVGAGEHEEDDDRSWPVVKFVGVTYPVHASWDLNVYAKMRGCVRRTKEGELRWTTWSSYDGEERWRSEGIQVGGVNSARGVLGTWFNKNYDRQGPAGPTAFWKISDEEPTESKDDDEFDIPVIFGYGLVHGQD